MTQKVLSARGRKIGSTRWLHRHINDPHVQRAAACGYRSRAAFKLINIDDKYNVLNVLRRKERASAANIPVAVDFGCAPGSWLQVVLERVQREDLRVIGVDLATSKMLQVSDLRVHLIAGDVKEVETMDVVQSYLATLLFSRVDLVLSDMAASSCGDKMTDHLRIMSLVNVAADFALQHLSVGGCFVAKMLHGKRTAEFLKRMRVHFTSVSFFKPQSSYADSTEIFIVCVGYYRYNIVSCNDAA